jgi:nucleoid-associated protein YejK
VWIHRGAAVSLVLAMSVISILGERAAFAFLFLSSSAWVSSSAVVAVFALIVSILVYRKTSELSRKIADRTVTIEAQKLLLEINKVLVSDPRLFALYDKEGDKLRGLIGTLKMELPKKGVTREAAEDLAGKLTAVSLMILNVFEIVFAQMPAGDEYNTWVNYFEDTLSKCTTVSELLKLDGAEKIYHPKLMKAFGPWREEDDKKKKAEGSK